jgi:hypothetical protein
MNETKLMVTLQSRDGSSEDFTRNFELEQNQLSAKLRLQQIQSEEDSKWLEREEHNLKKRLSLTTSCGSETSDSTSDVLYSTISPSSKQVFKKLPFLSYFC